MPRLLPPFGRISASFFLLSALHIGTCCCSSSSSCPLAFAHVDSMPPNDASSLRSPPQQTACSMAVDTASSVADGDAGQNSNDNYRSRHKWLVVDFDCTLTKYDTTPTLPLLAALHSGDDDEQRQRRLETFGNHEKEYFDAYLATKERLLNADSGEKNNDDDELPHLHDALESLDDVSTFVTNKVSESSCLAGLPSHPEKVADIINGDAELQRLTELQDGCTAAVANAYMNGWGLAVLSINWFPSLIEAAFVEPWRKHVHKHRQSDDGAGNGGKSKANGDHTYSIPRADVWCNDIDSDGVVTLHLPGASAKRERIRNLKERLLREHQVATESADSADDVENMRRPLVIYIGDSSTDLSGLLEADIGIMIGRSSTVLGIADRWKIPLASLKERRELCDGLHDDDKNTVWMADGWDDIEAVLDGL